MAFEMCTVFAANNLRRRAERLQANAITIEARDQSRELMVPGFLVAVQRLVTVAAGLFASLVRLGPQKAMRVIVELETFFRSEGDGARSIRRG
jgi:uncharacterized protein YgbK (DUF1537 family)